MKRNYQKELDALVEKNLKECKVPSLVLHSCCAPCSSYALEYLSDFFNINVLYYNPNISSKEEYQLRLSEQKRLIAELRVKYPVTLTEGEYEPSVFYAVAKGLEHCPERGERCLKCYRLRLEAAARLAKEQGADYFATTLTLSPLKSAESINEIGEELEKEYAVKYLPTDFKKKNGYKRSIELSRIHNLYRQNFCGCVYSK
ncbi:MAG: epoxyqueuosine reductase QueH [Ruminococcus sp.]|nr:epoxyqueuosine reductase QueH [Ruminococcus sp.]